MDVRVITNHAKKQKSDEDWKIQVDQGYTDISWSIGSCKSGLRYQVETSHAKTYSERCCLSPGEYNLQCHSNYPAGWNGLYMEIQGNRYCNDFMGHTALRKIHIKRKKIPILTYIISHFYQSMQS